MARKKVKLAIILNAKQRKSSYKKRKEGIMKKIRELCTLCGVDACIIIYSDFDHQQPQIWPSSPMVAKRVIAKFKTYPRAEQCRKMVNQEAYIKEMVRKATEKLEKLREENRKKEMSLLMYQYLTGGKILDNLSMVDLNDLVWVIGVKQNEIDYRLNALHKSMASTS